MKLHIYFLFSPRSLRKFILRGIFFRWVENGRNHQPVHNMKPCMRSAYHFWITKFLGDKHPTWLWILCAYGAWWQMYSTCACIYLHILYTYRHTIRNSVNILYIGHIWNGSAFVRLGWGPMCFANNTYRSFPCWFFLLQVGLQTNQVRFLTLELQDVGT